MEQLVIVVHVLLSIGIIGLVLLQQGKGAEMGASFGSGASQTLFGSAGTGNLFSHATAILAALFFATSIGLALLGKHKMGMIGDAGVPSAAVIESHNKSVAGDVPAAEPAVAPAADVPAAPATETAPAADVPVSDAPAAPAKP